MKFLFLLALKLLLTALKAPIVPIIMRPKKEWITQRDSLVTHLEGQEVGAALEIAKAMDFAYAERVSRESKMLFLNIWRKACMPFKHPFLCVSFFGAIGWLTWISIRWTWEYFSLVFWSTLIIGGVWWSYKKYKNHPSIKPILDNLGGYFDKKHDSFNVWVLGCVDEETCLQEVEAKDPLRRPLYELLQKTLGKKEVTSE